MKPIIRQSWLVEIICKKTLKDSARQAQRGAIEGQVLSFDMPEMVYPQQLVMLGLAPYYCARTHTGNEIEQVTH